MRGFPASIAWNPVFACPVSREVESTVSPCLLESPPARVPARLAAFAAGRPWALLAAIFLLTALVLLAVPASAAERHELIGKPAPDLVARGLTGQNVRVS